MFWKWVINMREIKFRAWVINPRNNIYGSPSVAKNLMFYNIIELTKDSLEQELPFAICDDIKFMQYTGLKDMNGKEIYEGDILKTKDLYQRYFVVEYSTRGFELYDNKNGVVHDPHNTWEDYEVIGNIYENPELLKGD
jgi:uncharacterized phage protein (TIGR01671 family)